MQDEDPDAQPTVEARAWRERLEFALAATQDGIWDWDIVADHTVYSARFVELLGYRDEADLHARFRLRDDVHPDDRPRIVAALDAHLLLHDEPFDADFRLRRADGSFLWVHGRGRAAWDAQGQPLRFCGALTDITRRVAAEDALRANEQKFRALAALSSDWYWQTDAAHRFVELIGDPERRSVPAVQFGLARWEIPSVDMSEATWAAHRAQLDRHEPFRDFEVRRRDEQGRLRVFLTSGEPRFDAGGRFLGYHGVGRDVTALHEAERERRRLEGQLREAQKMEAIGTLAGGIAHDFNNILGAILGNLALAAGELDAGHPARQRLDAIEQSAVRARALVRQILAFSRRQLHEPVPQPLRPIVTEALALLRATLPAGVALDAVLGDVDGGLTVVGDATQIHQVVMNLCINAWQAMQGRAGRVEVGLDAATVRVGQEPAPGLAPGLHARLRVRDDGCGMDAATLARIFEPFFTTKPAGQGTGLGLAVAHGIVAAHGGAVTAASTPGRGSVFEVWLPARQGQAAPPQAPERAAGPAAAKGERVLLVDDDEVMALVTASLLERAGHEVTLRTRPAEALRELAERASHFDLVVTDLNMPDVSGLDIARAVRSVDPALPVVVMSGYLANDAKQHAREAGVREFVYKEEVAEALVPAVRRALAGRLSRGGGAAR